MKAFLAGAMAALAVTFVSTLPNAVQAAGILDPWRFSSRSTEFGPTMIGDGTGGTGCAVIIGTCSIQPFVIAPLRITIATVSTATAIDPASRFKFGPTIIGAGPIGTRCAGITQWVAETSSVETLEAIPPSRLAIVTASAVIAIGLASPFKRGRPTIGSGIAGTECAGITPEIGGISSIVALGIAGSDTIAIMTAAPITAIFAASPRFEPQEPLANQGRSKEIRVRTVGTGFAGTAEPIGTS